MKVSREKMAENRTRILEEASRLFRAKGFDAVSVSEVMKACGLTHGGFYGHFASKDELIAESLAHVFETSPTEPPDMQVFSRTYLSDAHRGNAAHGCPIAALASDTARQDTATRAAMTDGLRAQLNRIGHAFASDDPEMARRSAIGTWSAMVGAMILARSCDDPRLSDEILRETRIWIGHDRWASDPEGGGQ